MSKKITALPDASGALDGSELVPIVQNDITVKVTTQQIADLGSGGGGGGGIPVGTALLLDNGQSSDETAPAIQRVRVQNDNFGGGGSGNDYSATSTVMMGYTEDGDGGIFDIPDENGLAHSSVFIILQREAVANENPGYVLYGVPYVPGDGSSDKANGIWLRGYSNGGGVYQQIVGTSSFGLANETDIGLEFIGHCGEFADATGGTTVFNFDARSTPQAGTNSVFPLDSGAFSMISTKIFNFCNFTIPKIWGRISGDLHTLGADYKGSATHTAGFTVSIDAHTHLYTGPAGNTAIIEDPSDPDNFDREQTILNHGTGALTLSRSVYFDATTSVTSLPFTYPDNSIKIKCIAGKWRLIP